MDWVSKPLLSVSEECKCGAKFLMTGYTQEELMPAVKAFRLDHHICRSR